MESSNSNTYCLFCRAGQEGRVVAKLEADGYAPFAPLVVRWKGKNGAVKKSVSRLLPGYVFFDSDTQPNWQDVRAIEPVLRILQYDDGVRALRGSDAEFVVWLKRNEGIIEVSRAMQVGTKLEFVDGPMKDMQGKIIKVNKNRKVVQVMIGGETSMMRTIWCSIEYIEANTDPDALKLRAE